MFDVVLVENGQAGVVDEDLWILTTCLKALDDLFRTVKLYFDTMLHLWPEILDLTLACALQDNENLAQVSVTSLQDFLKTKGPDLSEQQWTCIIEKLGAALKKNTPTELSKLHKKKKKEADEPAADNGKLDGDKSDKVDKPEKAAPPPPPAPPAPPAPPTPTQDKRLERTQSLIPKTPTKGKQPVKRSRTMNPKKDAEPETPTRSQIAKRNTIFGVNFMDGKHSPSDHSCQEDEHSEAAARVDCFLLPARLRVLTACCSWRLRPSGAQSLPAQAAPGFLRPPPYLPHRLSNPQRRRHHLHPRHQSGD